MTLSKTAVIYTRRSVESDQRTVSLVQQFKACEAYAQSLGIETLVPIQHDGVSGNCPDRFPEIDQALRDSKAKFLIVYSLDRLSRNAGAFFYWTRNWEHRGIEVHVANRGPIDLETASGFLSNGVEALIAEHYRRIISERTREALRVRRERGQRVSGKAPYGFRFDKSGNLLEEPQEQVTLQSILSLAPSRSLRTLSNELTRQGLYARNGKPFSASTLSQILRRQSQDQQGIIP